MKNLGPTLLALSTLAQLGGCKEYFSVDEACNDKLSGDKDLFPGEREAMLRLNCHRRLSQLAGATANTQVQQAARNALNYVLLNPTATFLNGSERERSWLRQLSNKQGFTGGGVRERLTDPVTGTGYAYFDELNTGTREFIDVQWTFGADPLPTGAAAIDHLIRDAEFRQFAMQGSWIDGAFAEVELTTEWFASAGMPEPLPTSGRAYYAVQMYTEPHREHVDRPIVYPKEGMKDVPTWSYTHVPSPTVPNEYTQAGFPLTFTFGAADEANFEEIEFNQYHGEIQSIGVIGPDGRPVDLELVYPGDESNGGFPDGIWLRTTLAAYPKTPLVPGEKYRLAAVVTSPEGEWDYDYEFTTMADDPGANPELQAIGAYTTTSTTSTP